MSSRDLRGGQPFRSRIPMIIGTSRKAEGETPLNTCVPLALDSWQSFPVPSRSHLPSLTSSGTFARHWPSTPGTPSPSLSDPTFPVLHPQEQLRATGPRLQALLLCRGASELQIICMHDINTSLSVLKTVNWTQSTLTCPTVPPPNPTPSEVSGAHLLIHEVKFKTQLSSSTTYRV